MKKLLILGVAFVAVLTLVCGYFSFFKTGNQNFNVQLANIEAISDSESGPVVAECPGGEEDCARIIVGNEVHIFMKP